mmetsp:Transcript_14621/g.34696  ORF Transcript_14621/g.34696 Transcript_14621/m.34696 type:complete len:112 (+) Transcript_14621:709-1044(+)
MSEASDRLDMSDMECDGVTSASATFGRSEATWHICRMAVNEPEFEMRFMLRSAADGKSCSNCHTLAEVDRPGDASWSLGAAGRLAPEGRPPLAKDINEQERANDDSCCVTS